MVQYDKVLTANHYYYIYYTAGGPLSVMLV